jgi:hypothetical protein
MTSARRQPWPALAGRSQPGHLEARGATWPSASDVHGHGEPPSGGAAPGWSLERRPRRAAQWRPRLHGAGPVEEEIGEGNGSISLSSSPRARGG